MSDQKKLLEMTPEDFIALYLAKNLLPQEGNIPVRAGRCCAIGVYAHDRYGPVPEYDDASFHDFYVQAAADLGVDPGLLTNFAVGFDRGFSKRTTIEYCCGEEGRHGYRVGEACRLYPWTPL